ncbi:hypothetical protein [uncultured Ruegeria sp.]|uniref:hypothetical protein n=1 Tax=uncultured Ruegeria sp. TaxID=259304 RepID=UPI0026040DDD|nr:hypothetical protein [uncultured Ruegeria sp.]
MAYQENMLVRQRLRNRQIEALELASSWPAQLKYQNEAPEVSVPSEVINQFDDVFHGDQSQLSGPLYSQSEEIALRKYSCVFNDVCQKSPASLPSLQEVFELSAWQELRDAAKEALDVMMVRGPFPEDTLKKDDV